MSYLQHQPIFESPLVSAFDVHCSAPKAASGAEEICATPRLIFPRRGVFSSNVKNRSFVADCKTVLLFNSGEVYRIAHPHSGGDDCTVLAFSEPMLREFLTDWGAQEADAAAPFCASHLLLSAIAQRNVQFLLRALRIPAHDALHADEIAIRILRIVFAHLSPDNLTRQHDYRRSPAYRERDQIEEVRSLVSGNPGANLTLSQLATAVCSSPFYLARRFRDSVGMSLHQYRLDMRVALAFNKLSEGCEDISGLASDLGFASHSHLTARFKSTYGLTPSQVRTLHISRSSPVSM